MFELIHLDGSPNGVRLAYGTSEASLGNYAREMSPGHYQIRRLIAVPVSTFRVPKSERANEERRKRILEFLSRNERSGVIQSLEEAIGS